MTDKGTVRIVVVFIGLITLVLVGAIVLLAALEKPTPTALETLSGASLGALVTLLVSTRSAEASSQPLSELVSASAAELVVQQPVSVQSAAAALPPSALGDQAAVPPGPMDSNLIKGYETGPADRPSAEALAAETMGVPPTQG